MKGGWMYFGRREGRRKKKKKRLGRKGMTK